MIKKIHIGLAGFMLMAFFLGGMSAFAEVSASGSAGIKANDVSSTVSYEAEVKPVKFFERLTLLLTFNQEKRARLLEDFSKRNFELAKEKISEGKTVEADVFFQKSNKDISRATLSTSRIKDVEVRSTAFARLSDMSSVRATVLADVQARIDNPTAKEAIGRAILKQEDMRASLEVKINKSNENAGSRGGNGIGISAVNPACTPTSTPYIKVLSPNGGEEYVAGEQITVTWEKCNLTVGSQVMIILKSTQSNFGAEIATVPNTGSASIILPSVLGGGQASVIPGSYYKIRLEVGGNAMGAQVPYSDESDNVFKIGVGQSGVSGLGISAVNPACTPTSTPYIKVLSPNGGEEYVAGEQITVTWQSCNNPHTPKKVAVRLSNGNEGYAYYLSGDNALNVGSPDTGSLTANLPPANHISVNSGSPVNFETGSNFRIEVFMYPVEWNQYVDYSDNLFTIQ